MAASFVDEEKSELSIKFENWFAEKLKTSDQDVDSSIFTNYILSTLNTDDSSDEEKSEAILPFLQELNQNGAFNEQELLDEIIRTWNEMKTDFEQNQNVNRPIENQENPTDTILNMINKHKTQLVKVKKPQTQDDEEDNDEDEDNDDHAASHFVYVESDEEEEGSSKNKSDDLFVNKNTEDAVNREKVKRDKMAEATRKQKEQTKKALIEQRQREEDKKKKAQQKTAKVERKR